MTSARIAIPNLLHKANPSLSVFSQKERQPDSFYQTASPFYIIGLCRFTAGFCPRKPHLYQLAFLIKIHLELQPKVVRQIYAIGLCRFTAGFCPRKLHLYQLAFLIKVYLELQAEVIRQIPRHQMRFQKYAAGRLPCVYVVGAVQRIQLYPFYLWPVPGCEIHLCVSYQYLFHLFHPFSILIAILS